MFKFLNVYPRNISKLFLYQFAFERNLSTVPQVSTKKVFTREDIANYPLVDYKLANASRTDLGYYFFRDSEKTRAYVIDNQIQIDFNRNLPIKCLIHGYLTNYKSPWMETVNRKYFEQGPHNILLIDWSKAASLSYRISAANTQTLGEYVAEFLLTTNIPLEKIHLIGHSLGGHLSGFVGKSIHKHTGKKLGRITALDPAGVAFDRLTDDSLHLCANDAEFVDVIHTDIDYFGFKRPLGHVDIYPNGGKNQPGCNRYVDDTCSHFRSTRLFIESIGNTAIKAKQARYIEEEIIEIIDDGNEIGFGDSLTGNERGTYFIRTTDKPPFFVN